MGVSGLVDFITGGKVRETMAGKEAVWPQGRSGKVKSVPGRNRRSAIHPLTKQTSFTG
jgi:hypothetical protein